MRYQCWSNKPTYLIHRAIEHTKSWDDYVYVAARLDPHPEKLAAKIKRLVQLANPLQAGIYERLIDHALRQVDWLEIAISILDSLKEAE